MIERPLILIKLRIYFSHDVERQHPVFCATEALDKATFEDWLGRHYAKDWMDIQNEDGSKSFVNLENVIWIDILDD